MITLLIADDHPLYRDALKGSLSLSLPALTLKEAGDLTTTVDILKQEDIDLLLLDLHILEIVIRSDFVFRFSFVTRVRFGFFSDQPAKIVELA